MRWHGSIIRRYRHSSHCSSFTGLCTLTGGYNNNGTEQPLTKISVDSAVCWLELSCCTSELCHSCWLLTTHARSVWTNKNIRNLKNSSFEHKFANLDIKSKVYSWVVCVSVSLYCSDVIILKTPPPLSRLYKWQIIMIQHTMLW